MCNCCLKSVPPDSGYQAFGQPVQDWRERLLAGLDRSVRASDQSLGHIEAEIAHHTRDLERAVAQEAAQNKADQTRPHCPVCGDSLGRLTHGHERTVQTRFCPIQLKRSRGWCRRCGAWRFPADHALGIDGGGTASPAVQEMAALLGSKMPLTAAHAVLQRLTGVALPRATLDREAQRRGERAQAQRDALDQAMQTAAGARAQSRVLPAAPFTLIIEIDAWNIRERDDWG
jgi:hypothetical protein